MNSKMDCATQDYCAYGLSFRSEVPLPDVRLAVTPDAPDVVVRRASLAGTEFDSVDTGVFWKTAPGKFRIDIDDVASYLVLDGREILVDALPSASDTDVALFLMGSVTGALLHQRGFWPLHASAVNTSNGAVLFAGRSGAGKSTLMAGLNHRGFEAISDDISAIVSSPDSQIAVMPAVPRVKVCEDAAEYFGINTTALQQVTSRRKFIAPIENYASQATPIRRIVFLGFTTEESCNLSDVAGAEAITHLTQSTYRRKFMKGLGLHASHFPLLSSVAKTIPLSVLRRPEKLSAIGQTLDRLETLLG